MLWYESLGFEVLGAWRQGAFSSACWQGVGQRSGVAVQIVMFAVMLHVSLDKSHNDIGIA